MLVSAALLIGGSVLVLLGLWSFSMLPRTFLDARRDAAEARRATARVIELTEEPARGEDSLPTWHPVIRFEDEHGHEHTVQARFGTAPSKWSVGDEITVWYPPSAPEQADIDHWFSTYHPVLVALVFGLVGSGGGAGLILIALLRD